VNSIMWTLLEFVLPLETWLRLELHGLPQVAAWLILAAVVGAIAVTVVARGLRQTPQLCGAVSHAFRRTFTPRDPQDPDPRDTPRGGAGPRAPAARQVRLSPAPSKPGAAALA
jgi:hypothetical protein